MRGGLGLRVLLYVDAPSAWQIAVGSVTTKKSKQPEVPVVHAAQTLPHISFIFFIPWWGTHNKDVGRVPALGWRTCLFLGVLTWDQHRQLHVLLLHNPGPENTIKLFGKHKVSDVNLYVSHLCLLDSSVRRDDSDGSDLSDDIICLLCQKDDPSFLLGLTLFPFLLLVLLILLL